MQRHFCTMSNHRAPRVNEEIPLPNSFVYESRTSAGSRREAALNWLALGLLLAAWMRRITMPVVPCAGPEVLRHYDYVSVRAANQVSAKGW